MAVNAVVVIPVECATANCENQHRQCHYDGGLRQPRLTAFGGH